MVVTAVSGAPKNLSVAFRAITMLPGTGGTTRVYTVPASAAPGDLLVIAGAEAKTPIDAQSGAGFKENASSKTPRSEG